MHIFTLMNRINSISSSLLHMTWQDPGQSQRLVGPQEDDVGWRGDSTILAVQSYNSGHQIQIMRLFLFTSLSSFLKHGWLQFLFECHVYGNDAPGDSLHGEGPHTTKPRGSLSLWRRIRTQSPAFHFSTLSIREKESKNASSSKKVFFFFPSCS